MESGNIFNLKNQFSTIIDEHHDSMVFFEIKDTYTIVMKAIGEEADEELFEIKLYEPIKGNFTIYENLDEDEPLHYEITDNNKEEDLAKCRFELIDVYASSDALLIHGDKKEGKRYSNEIIVKIASIDHIRT